MIFSVFVLMASYIKTGNITDSLNTIHSLKIGKSKAIGKTDDLPTIKLLCIAKIFQGNL